ncbi:MAG: YbbR-like domain-containing protein, partial [Clostridia bacterium]|nr:YbbR-like domain-containing protein [Clostridia bacterium]
MKNIFSNDNSLKVISVIVAILIWIYIIIVLDPAVEVNVRDLPIQFVGEEVLAERGISVVNESATAISIKVQGSRKRMGKYDMKTIIARVDMSGINEVGQTSLPVEVVVPFENVGISSQSHYNVQITTEELVEKQINLDIKTEGSLAENYMAGDITLSPESVTIKGPKSVVGKINKAGILLEYANADVDIDVELPIRFYGVDEKIIPVQDALMKRISQDIQSTKVHCEVVKLREVNITPRFSAESYDERDAVLNDAKIAINPETVLIYGDDKVTAKIGTIYTTEVPVEKFIDNKKAKAKLIIPEGVKILKDIT